MTNPWVQSARLRTLPLALSSVLLGTSLSNLHGPVYWDLFALVVFISVGLQILSNYANDYGDFLKGTDTQAGRKDRMLSANKIRPQQMKQVLIGLSGAILGLGYIHTYVCLPHLRSIVLCGWYTLIFWTVSDSSGGYVYHWEKSVWLFWFR